MRPPLFLASIAFFLAAIASGVAEKIFYGGRIDENGVLQESFFLPLTFIFLVAAVATLLIFVLRRLLKR